MKLHLGELDRRDGSGCGDIGSGRAFGPVLPHAKIPSERISILLGPAAGVRLAACLVPPPADVARILVAQFPYLILNTRVTAVETPASLCWRSNRTTHGLPNPDNSSAYDTGRGQS